MMALMMGIDLGGVLRFEINPGVPAQALVRFLPGAGRL
jgi:hypothetical protein